MTFMEWLQDTLDFSIIESLVIDDDTPFITAGIGKEDECKAYIILIIIKSQAQLTPEGFSEVMAPWIQNMIKDPNANRLGLEISLRMNCKRKANHHARERTEAKSTTNHAKVHIASAR